MARILTTRFWFGAIWMKNKGDFGRPGGQESRICLLTFAKAEFAVFLHLLSSHSERTTANPVASPALALRPRHPSQTMLLERMHVRSGDAPAVVQLCMMNRSFLMLLTSKQGLIDSAQNQRVIWLQLQSKYKINGEPATGVSSPYRPLLK